MKNKAKEGNEPVISFTTFSFGCRVNEAERQALESRLIEAGYTFDNRHPDVCFIHTCAVTAKAVREARQLIYQLQRQYPKAKIIVTGCAAAYWRKNALPPLSSQVTISESRDPSTLILKGNRGIPRLQQSPVGMMNNNKMIKSGRLLLKIQDGCQRFCTYCIVPYLRGRPKSETIQNLEFRVKNFETKIQEVILTAINTEAFGYDTGEKFTDLLKTIIDKTTVPRISCGSINPWSVNDDFLRFYKKNLTRNRFVNFFHIPLQSGSNKILALMKRGYTAEEFMKKVNAIHKINPFALIATDVIVGFLDETEKDFEDTYRFLEKSPIAKFHIFRYSKRDNTAACFMAKRLREPQAAVKNERAKRLKALGDRKYNQFLSALIDYNSTALFIDKREDGYQKALLDNQIPAWIKAEKNLNGHIKNVRITEFKKGELFGKID